LAETNALLRLICTNINHAATLHTKIKAVLQSYGVYYSFEADDQTSGRIPQTLIAAAQAAFRRVSSTCMDVAQPGKRNPNSGILRESIYGHVGYRTTATSLCPIARIERGACSGDRLPSATSLNSERRLDLLITTACCDTLSLQHRQDQSPYCTAMVLQDSQARTALLRLAPRCQCCMCPHRIISLPVIVCIPILLRPVHLMFDAGRSEF